MSPTLIAFNTSDFMLMNYSNTSEHTLQELEWEIFVEQGIPVTVFLCVMSVVGTLGNALVILTVGRCGRWLNYKILIQYLSVNDLFSCAFSIPGYIVLTRFPYTLRSDAFCKSATMFHIFVGAYSVDLLCFIALERFRKTCRPFKPQFTVKYTKIVIACLAVFNLALASFGLFTFSAQPIPVHVGNLIGIRCMILKESIFAKVFSKTLSLLLLLKIVVCTILYIIIGNRILKHRKQRPRTASFRFQSSRNSKQNSNEESYKDFKSETVNGAQRMSAKSVTSFELSISSRNGDSTRHKNALKGKALFTKSARISFMFLMCTCLSFISFVPVLIIRCVESFDWQLRKDMFEYLGPMAAILYRFHVLNHVINPIVYCLTNASFRRDCTSIFKCQ
ncbi:cholecystokinin receptor type A-like [Argopecten irradians]|uniref:cholecystokinin receptor type A-like n=1 Tax=Argopecten irradians TaxID=31199 RepID=UPI003715ED15